MSNGLIYLWLIYVWEIQPEKVVFAVASAVEVAIMLYGICIWLMINTPWRK